MYDLQCAICGRQTDLDTAVDEDWTPTYWIAQLEIDDPVCLPCVERHMQLDDDGTMTLATRDQALINRLVVRRYQRLRQRQAALQALLRQAEEATRELAQVEASLKAMEA